MGRRGYGAFADECARNFAERGELGAAAAVFVGGRKVVDLWGGIADDRTGREWQEDTVLPVMSLAKAVVSFSAHLLAQQGTLDLDAPVAATGRSSPGTARRGSPPGWCSPTPPESRSSSGS